MVEGVETGPVGARPTDGILHKSSPLPLAGTVERLTAAIDGAGATLFAVVDHSGEAARVGLALRDTKLVIFGNPRGGTPAMSASPLAAIDLPLKVLVWEDDAGRVWLSYLSPAWLAKRHGLSAELVAPFAAVELLTDEVVAHAARRSDPPGPDGRSWQGGAQ